MAEHHFAELDIIVMNQLQADKKWPFVEKLVQVRGPKYMYQPGSDSQQKGGSWQEQGADEDKRSGGSWLSTEAAQQFPSEFPMHSPKIETLLLNS